MLMLWLVMVQSCSDILLDIYPHHNLPADLTSADVVQDGVQVLLVKLKLQVVLLKQTYFFN